LFFPGCA